MEKYKTPEAQVYVEILEHIREWIGEAMFMPDLDVVHFVAWMTKKVQGAVEWHYRKPHSQEQIREKVKYEWWKAKNELVEELRSHALTGYQMELLNRDVEIIEKNAYRIINFFNVSGSSNINISTRGK